MLANSCPARSGATIYEYDASQTLVRSKSSIGNTPTGLDVDANGNVYVALSGDHKVAKYLPNGGTFQLDSTFGTAGLIGSFGTGDGQFNTPYDVAVSPDGMEIAVSDSGNHRIRGAQAAGPAQHLHGYNFGLGRDTDDAKAIVGRRNDPRHVRAMVEVLDGVGTHVPCLSGDERGRKAGVDVCGKVRMRRIDPRVQHGHSDALSPRPGRPRLGSVDCIEGPLRREIEVVIDRGEFNHV